MVLYVLVCFVHGIDVLFVENVGYLFEKVVTVNVLVAVEDFADVVYELRVSVVEMSYPVKSLLENFDDIFHIGITQGLPFVRFGFLHSGLLRP